MVPIIKPGIEIEEKEPARNQKCMGCYQLLFRQRMFIVRANFSRIEGGWFRLCESCMKAIFKEDMIKNGFKKNNN